jgi:molecular chaperone DnaJ
VKIPAGIADGQRLRLHGEGEHGAAGGPAGDLYVVIHVEQHPIFHREGDDLFVEVPVPFSAMTLGGSFELVGPGGAKFEVAVPAGSQSGVLLPFRGKGMPSLAGHLRGALYVRAVVDVPRKLSKEQRKLVEQLAKTTPTGQITPRSIDSGEDKPFFERVKDLFG